MSERNTTVIKESAVQDLLHAILAGGARLVAPVDEAGRNVFRPVDSAEQVSLPRVSAANSIKEFFFPSWEVILGYSREGGGLAVVGPAHRGARTVVFGARPCDAAGLAILDHVFNWDTVDPSWKAARDASTVIAVGCRESDQYCFCTSVGLSPSSGNGADLLLIPAADEEYIAEALTDKGEAIVAANAHLFREVAAARAAVADVPRRFDSDRVTRALEKSFHSPLWTRSSERCLGCGVCTYYCPTCHCFDIQDEADGRRGVRLRAWDSCSFALFTRHTSGHNPRGDQAARWRQRIMHKFSYYPALFGVISCTGCGRCGRLCPVDLGVEETLEAVEEEST